MGGERASTEKGWIAKKRGCRCGWMKEAEEGGDGKVSGSGWRGISLAPTLSPPRLSERPSLFVLWVLSLALSYSFAFSLANSLAHSRTFLSILLLFLRRPDALGIRVSSSPSASLCRRSFFLRLSLLVPFLSSSLSLYYPLPSPPSRCFRSFFVWRAFSSTALISVLSHRRASSFSRCLPVALPAMISPSFQRA